MTNLLTKLSYRKFGHSFLWQLSANVLKRISRKIRKKLTGEESLRLCNLGVISSKEQKAIEDHWNENKHKYQKDQFH